MNYNLTISTDLWVIGSENVFFLLQFFLFYFIDPYIMISIFVEQRTNSSFHLYMDKSFNRISISNRTRDFDENDLYYSLQNANIWRCTPGLRITFRHRSLRRRPHTYPHISLKNRLRPSWKSSVRATYYFK